MTGAFTTRAAAANLVATELGPLSPHNGAIVATVKNLFPQHTRKTLARILGLSDGAARKKLTGERAFSVDELAVLLRSEQGIHFLVALMADAEPPWWSRVQAYFAAIDAQRMQRAARRRLREAINDDAELSAAIARADALLVHDEDFHRPMADAVRAVARVPSSAVATATKRKR